jgi:hypothetical protein
MANVDSPRGFEAVDHYYGGRIRTRSKVLTASAEVFKGDVLKIVAGGTIEVAAVDIGLAAIGIAESYRLATASGAEEVNVWEDPGIIYVVQTDSGTASAATDRGTTANHVAGTGSSTTKMSGHELDSSQMAAQGGAQFKVIDLYPITGNAWGEHSDVLVIFNEHWGHAAVAGV